jgi:hypothetical protein
VLARCAAARLDRELAAGASPETSATLAARAIQLTWMRHRRDLATSVQRILAAAGEPPEVMPAPAVAVHPPRLPLRRAWISRSAVPLARLAGYPARSRRKVWRSSASCLPTAQARCTVKLAPMN